MESSRPAKHAAEPSARESGSLAGRRVLITGPARGIGERTARLAAARGARLGLVGLEPTRLGALARELGEDHHWAECDVTDQRSLDDAVASTVSALGGIDVVVANAGIGGGRTVAIGPVEAMVRTVEVNLNGVIRTVSATLPHLIAAKGYALLISSAAAFTAMPGMAAYCASKAGVEQFGNVLRLETAHLGVAVGTAHPIWIDTDLVRSFSAAAPSFEATRRKLPWPLNSLISVDACAEAFVRAIERRQRKVYVPRSMAAVQALRTFMLSRLGERITARVTGGGAFVAQLEAEARAADNALTQGHAG
jgi:short-subunit dehydrogenase